MTTETFGILFAMLGTFSGLMIWFMTRMENRIHADITSITERLDKHISDSRNEWNSTNARIDTTQAIIMRMLEKQGR